MEKAMVTDPCIHSISNSIVLQDLYNSSEQCSTCKLLLAVVAAFFEIDETSLRNFTLYIYSPENESMKIKVMDSTKGTYTHHPYLTCVKLESTQPIIISPCKEANFGYKEVSKFQSFQIPVMAGPSHKTRAGRVVLSL